MENTTTTKYVIAWDSNGYEQYFDGSNYGCTIPENAIIFDSEDEAEAYKESNDFGEHCYVTELS